MPARLSNRVKMYMFRYEVGLRRDPENTVRGWSRFFSHQRISQRVVRTSLEKQLDPRGPNASRGGPYQIYKATSVWPLVIFQVCECVVWWGGVGPPAPSLDPPMGLDKTILQCNYIKAFLEISYSMDFNITSRQAAKKTTIPAGHVML